jgi:hypothetical protein
MPGAGKSATSLVSADSKFLVVVDDINRADGPARLVRKILSWASFQKSSPQNRQSRSERTLIICPIWPQLLETDIRKRARPWLDLIIVGNLSPEEGVAAVHATAPATLDITDAEAEALSKQLGNDPLLIGVLGCLLKTTKQSDLKKHGYQVIENFIGVTLADVSGLTGSRNLPADYRAALSTLNALMLRARRLYPRWAEIRLWLETTPDLLDALRN